VHTQCQAVAKSEIERQPLIPQPSATMTDSIPPLRTEDPLPANLRKPAARPRRASISLLLLCVLVGAVFGLGAVLVGYGLSTLLP